MAKADQFAPELLISLDGSGPKSLRSSLERRLRDAIRSGRLHPGTPVPSTRALARELRVSRGVVVEAYAQLAAEGYLATRQGAPTRVAAVRGAARARSDGAGEPPPSAPRFDLRPQVPDLSAFPRREWQASMRRALAAMTHAELDYPDPRGMPALRTALAAYLGRARGVVASADRVVITSGTFQSLGLVARVLIERGHPRVAVEYPGFHIHRMLLERLGVELVRVPVDEHGIDVDRLEGSGAAAVLVTPAHQMPLGMLLAPQRRAALVDWAERRQAYVLEDDYDGEYRYDREPVGALQGLAPERVVYLGSASKTLAPALRLGWMVAPASLHSALANERGWIDVGSPALDQLALADFVERGELDRHLRRARLGYRRRRDRLVAELGAHLPELEVGGVAAGLHVTARTPQPIDEDALVRAAGEHGLAIIAFRTRVGGEPASILMLGYSNVVEPAIARAVRALAAAYRR